MYACNPSAGEQSLIYPWGVMIFQLSLLGKLQTPKETKWTAPRVVEKAIPLHLHRPPYANAHLYTHECTHMHLPLVHPHA